MCAVLQHAERHHAAVSVLEGGDELAKGVVTIKDLKLGAKIAAGLGEDREAYSRLREQVQQQVSRAELAASVQHMLARQAKIDH